MIHRRNALQCFLLSWLTASSLLSPAAADATISVGKSRTRSGELPRTLLGNPSEASAIVFGQPGTNKALQVDCSSNQLTMATLDLTSSYQMWKYVDFGSDAQIQSVACPNKVITIDSSCAGVSMAASDFSSDSQRFIFTTAAGVSDDETTGVTISSSDANCSVDKVLTDGGSDGSIGNTIEMSCKYSLSESSSNFLLLRLHDGMDCFCSGLIFYALCLLN